MRDVKRAAAFDPAGLTQNDNDNWVGLYLLFVDIDIPYGGRDIYYAETTINNEFSYTVTDIPTGTVTQIGGSKDQIKIHIQGWGDQRPSQVFYHPEKERFYVA